MGQGPSQNLFLDKFPQFREQWTRNQTRIEGFIAYTRAAGEEKKTHVRGKPWTYGDSIDVSALPSLEHMNALGFFTTDSQIGIDEGENREKAYCEGFIPERLLEPFMQKLRECNAAIRFVVYPNDDNPEDVVLTIDGGREYSWVPVYRQKDLQEYLVQLVLNAGQDGSTNSYYSGKPVGYIDIDLNRWSFIIVYDTEFGHNALDKTGLFTCIEQALEKALTEYNPQTAGRRRRRRSTRKNKKHVKV
jgi:hypothetical protein